MTTMKGMGFVYMTGSHGFIQSSFCVCCKLMQDYGGWDSNLDAHLVRFSIICSYYFIDIGDKIRINF